jgi:epoxyqueuosine reductase
MPDTALTQNIQTHAEELGFDACAIAAAVDVDPDDTLGDWLARGFHADMQWMARSKAVRQDVQQKLPGTRSVVVVARNYYAERPDAPEKSGRVSRYAWGRDYHRALFKPVRRLAKYIEDQAPDTETYCSIDSGPVLEKVWAQRAGLGWIGKNSLVLRRDLGSWFFLSCILTTAELDPDPPVADGCLTCTACLDACPTGAIVEPQVVDSNRCISYQTIENRSDIPGDIQEKSDDWIFGCDICQEVCPWNNRAAVTDQPDFHPRPGHANPALDDLAAMDDDVFLETFAGTPLMRTKRAGIQRNTAIARRNGQAES